MEICLLLFFLLIYCCICHIIFLCTMCIILIFFFFLTINCFSCLLAQKITVAFNATLKTNEFNMKNRKAEKSMNRCKENDTRHTQYTHTAFDEEKNAWSKTIKRNWKMNENICHKKTRFIDKCRKFVGRVSEPIECRPNYENNKKFTLYDQIVIENIGSFQKTLYFSFCANMMWW